MAKKSTATEQSSEQSGEKAAPAPPITKKKTSVLKKLTVKEICGIPLVAKITEAGGAMKLCRIAGFATGTKHGESNYGNWSAITGEFSGMSFETGEIFMAGTAIIPGAFGDLLIGTVENAQREDAAASVRFSVDVHAKISDRDPNKYEYVVTPNVESTHESPALALLAIEE